MRRQIPIHALVETHGALREAYPQGRPNPAWRAEVAALAARRHARLAAELSGAVRSLESLRVGAREKAIRLANEMNGSTTTRRRRR